MVNSCTGKMGQAVAEAALRAGVELVPFTLCGPGEQKPVDIEGHKIALVGPEERDAKVAELKKQYPNLMAVDYTLPDAIHSMVDFYVKHDIPFVMGTTGGDRAKINAQVSVCLWQYVDEYIGALPSQHAASLSVHGLQPMLCDMRM